MKVTGSFESVCTLTTCKKPCNPTKSTPSSNCWTTQTKECTSTSGNNLAKGTAVLPHCWNREKHTRDVKNTSDAWMNWWMACMAHMYTMV